MVEFEQVDVIPFVSGGLMTGIIALLMKYVGGKAAMAVYGVPIALVISLLFVMYGSGLDQATSQHRVRTTVAHLLPAIIRMTVSLVILYVTYRLTDDIITAIVFCLVSFLILMIFHLLFVGPSKHEVWNVEWAR